MVTKYKLLLLSTMFIVQQSALLASAAPKPAAPAKKWTTLPQVHAAAIPPAAAPGSAPAAADASADDADDESATKTFSLTTAPAVAGAPAARPASAKKGKAQAATPAPAAATPAAAPATPASANVPDVQIVPAVVPAGAQSPIAALAPSAAPAAALAAVAAVAANNTGAKPSDIKLSVEEAHAQRSQFGRTFLSSLSHKLWTFKPQDLLGRLKALNNADKLSFVGDAQCAKLITDAALEAAESGDGIATILETLPLLKAKARGLQLVNETARRTYRSTLRKEKNKHVAIGEDTYDADIKAAQAAYTDAVEKAAAKYKGTKEYTQKLHTALLLTYDVDGDSDVEEMQETYAEDASLAGVKPEQLRGVAKGKLIVQTPLKEQRKIIVGSGAATPAASK